MKYKVVTLGCRTNQYESQAYIDQLQGIGYVEGDDADLVVVNTCTVTEQADKKSLYAIRQIKRKNPRAKVVVTGCLVERKGEEILALPEVDQVVGNLEKEELIRKALPEVESLPEFQIKRFDAHTRAFVKVQDGCNSYCSYCVIPFVRGRSRSKQMDEILDEVRGVVASGYKEIVLTGINIGDFDGGGTLADLVRNVDAIPGIERLRISSIDPDEVDDDLLDAVVNGKNTCHSMHIVLQSGSNAVLKKMRRKYTIAEFYETVDRLLAASPKFTFTTDIIVGFPGETEDDFQQTLQVIERVRFAKVHMFPFSSRPYTRAARMPDHVPADEISRRKQILMRAAEKTALRLRGEFVGGIEKVLIESADPMREGHVTGHTDGFLQVSLPKGELKQHDLIDVEITENGPDGLIGKEVSYAGVS